MGTFYARRNGLVLYGPTAADREAIARLPERVDVRCNATVPRDGGNHRHFFKLVRAVWENLPDHVHMTEEQLREELLIAAGHGERCVNWRGEVKFRAKSIAWAKMDETAFKALKDQVIHVICREIIPGFTSEDAEAAVFEVMG